MTAQRCDIDLLLWDETRLRHEVSRLRRLTEADGHKNRPMSIMRARQLAREHPALKRRIHELERAIKGEDAPRHYMRRWFRLQSELTRLKIKMDSQGDTRIAISEVLALMLETPPAREAHE